jgi:hypothetical protein
VASQQLLTKSEVFQDQILARTTRTANPANEVPEPHDHGKNLIESLLVQGPLSHWNCECTVF